MSFNCYQHTLSDTPKERGPKVHSGESLRCLTVERKIMCQLEQIEEWMCDEELYICCTVHKMLL